MATPANKRDPFPDMISVVIPTFNDSEQLAFCLDRLEQQDRADLIEEIWVVDNGSREPPAEICARHAKVRLLSEATPGPGPARTTGARRATQPILAFIDSDCFADPEWAAAIAAHFERPDAAEIIGGDVRIHLTGERMTGLEAFESVFGYRFALYVRRDKFCGTGNMAVRRDIFERVGPFAGMGVAEDRDWGQRATAMGYVVAYEPRMKVATPARRSFAELTRKWDRHIHHDFEEMPPGIASRIKWFIKSVAMAASPLIDGFRLLLSPRLRGFSNRMRGIACLTRIRLYRSAKMLSLLAMHDARAAGEHWRKVG